ncbi:hypothetical protein IW262DRAFT_1297364 [Armillaria fumosa]|nr:hypothetical protein IW262DRAFT_1297364 [Armillaria fumosa]
MIEVCSPTLDARVKQRRTFGTRSRETPGSRSETPWESGFRVKAVSLSQTQLHYSERVLKSLLVDERKPQDSIREISQIVDSGTRTYHRVPDAGFSSYCTEACGEDIVKFWTLAVKAYKNRVLQSKPFDVILVDVYFMICLMDVSMPFMGGKSLSVEKWLGRLVAVARNLDKWLATVVRGIRGRLRWDEVPRDIEGVTDVGFMGGGRQPCRRWDEAVILERVIAISLVEREAVVGVGNTVDVPAKE